MANRNVLLDFINVLYKAKTIKSDEEMRQKSISFGVTGIIFSIIAVAFAAAAAYLLSLLTGGDSNATLLMIFVIAGLAVCAGCAVLMLLSALLRVIAQLYINKKPIGWVALAILVLCVAAIVVLFIVLL